MLYASTGQTNAISALLSTNAQYLFSGYQPPNNNANIGIYDPSPYTNLYLFNGQTNTFGLTYQSILRLYSDGTTLHTTTPA